MITLTTTQGIIHMPVPPADDALTIQGLCSHGVSLFWTCLDCEEGEYPRESRFTKCEYCGTNGDHYCWRDVCRAED